MAIHDDAAAIDTAIAALEAAIEDLQDSANAADVTYRAANHGQPDPKNETWGRSVAAAIRAQPLVAKVLGANQHTAITLADIWPAE